MGLVGRDRLRRARLGALLGVGGLALAACAQAGAASAVPPVRGPSPSAAPVTPAASAATPGVTPGPTPSASIGRGEGTLRVLTFQGYVEYGGTSSRVNWLTPFERETGCVVRLDRVRTSEEMAARFATGAYDAVSPAPDLAGLLVAQGKVAPLDTALVKDYKQIPKRLRELSGLREDGRVYGIPYLWGVNRVVYEEGRPEGSSALYGTSPAAIRNSPLSIADAALALGETRPELKTEDPFQLTSAQLDAAVRLLAAGDGPDRVYWDGSLDLVRALSAGPVRIAQALPYHLDLFRRAGRPMKALEGVPMTGWVDSWMLAARPASPNCAYRWLNWVSSASAQRPAAAWTGLAPANPEACGGHARRMCEVYHVRDKRWLRDVVFATRPTRDCGGQGGECTDYTDWAERWKQLLK
ncbi:ABC transporter substrate-binding protein [Streptosporangium sp. NBC_01495]|uniref:ABC transporter substrate-binding protein n=1 Tax=Streptosporangium sp. NBC_01495 TaxID=2903899 RepID=UPI002E341125|nr:ABC transporter substrate-binding protein [Streptosporangium sp. NBC_01495]